MQYIDGSGYFNGLRFNIGTRSTTLVSKSGDSTGFISFETGPTPTEKVRIDPAGNVGIATTSPVAKLHVNGTSQFEQLLRINHSITPQISFYKPGVMEYTM